MKFNYTKKEIRQWALILAAILTVIAVIQFLVWHHNSAATVFWIIALVFFIDGWLFPSLLKPVYWLWLIFAAALAWVNTRLIMGIVFYLIFSPIGIILRVLRVDLIKQRRDPDAESYWIKRPDQPFDRSRYEKQY